MSKYTVYRKKRGEGANLWPQMGFEDGDGQSLEGVALAALEVQPPIPGEDTIAVVNESKSGGLAIFKIVRRNWLLERIV